MSASLTIKRHVPKACSTCVCSRHHYRHKAPLEASGGKKKKRTRTVSPALKLCHIRWSLGGGGTIFVTCGAGDSLPLDLITAICVCVFSLQGSRCFVACEDGRYFNGQDCQPCHRFCATCAGIFYPRPFVYSSGSGLAFICF